VDQAVLDEAERVVDKKREGMQTEYWLEGPSPGETEGDPE
jgi:hypothetical protein